MSGMDALFFVLELGIIWLGVQELRKRARHSKDANIILNTNKQLSICLSARQELVDQVKAEDDKLSFVGAFSTMFTSFGAQDGLDIIERQRSVLDRAQDALSANLKEEENLQQQIKENKLDISEYMD